VLIDKAPSVPKGALNIAERRAHSDNLSDVTAIVLDRSDEVLIDIEPRAGFEHLVVLIAGGFVVLKSFFHTIIISEFPTGRGGELSDPIRGL